MNLSHSNYLQNIPKITLFSRKRRNFIYHIYFLKIKEGIQLKILTEKDTSKNGEWISYSIAIANNSKQSIYYKVSSYSMKIIGGNGFHVITDIDNILNSIYELKPNSKVKRNMTEYNEYLDFPHVMGIKTFSSSIRLENTIDSVAELFLNWTAALSLPEGNYIIQY